MTKRKRRCIVYPSIMLAPELERKESMFMIKTNQLLDLRRSVAGAYLAGFEYPWQALPGIGALIPRLAATLGPEYRERFPQVWVHDSVTIAPTASVAGPCIIGPGTEIRHCAYIRGNVIIGANCVVSNSSELKNCIIFDEAQIPHFNYVGDSIMGYHTHVGGGAMTSNLKGDKSEVVVRCGGDVFHTGLKKFGAIIGDYGDIGANSLLNPGTIIGRNSRVYPGVVVRGVVPENHIYKDRDEIVPIR